MNYPPLPPPTIIDGRMVYTAGDMRAYVDADRIQTAERYRQDVPTTKRDTPAYDTPAYDMPPGFETLFRGFK